VARLRVLTAASRPARAARETVLVIFAYLAYFGVRGLTEGNYDLAIDNAGAIVHLEKALGFFWEPAIQRLILDQKWVVRAANEVYIFGHWPVIAAVAVWLFMRRPRTYSLLRNAFFISGAIGIIVFATFPVAPPRLAGIGLVDTITLHSNSYRVLQPPAFVNQYAAVPSLHFGWNLLIGIALFTQSPRVVMRAFGAVVPLMMASAIVLTANHYVFDAVAGAVVALAGLAVAYMLQRRALGTLGH